MIDAKRLYGKSIGAKDGHIGAVHDLYFDDQWIVRYLVVDTRKWLPGRKVLIATNSARGQMQSVQDLRASIESGYADILEEPILDSRIVRWPVAMPL